MRFFRSGAICAAVLAITLGSSYGWAKKTLPAKAVTPDVHTIVAVGDIMLSGKAESVLAVKGYDYPFRNTKLAALISSADVAFANLEYPVTARGEQFEQKKYTFKGKPESLTAVRQAGFRLLSLANNHTMDFGPDGLQSTLRYCNQRKLVAAGAGMDLSEARHLRIVKRNGVRFGLLAYSLTYPKEFWATADTAGTCYGNRSFLEEDIPRATPQVDILIVSFHWGEELNPVPKPYQIALGRLAVDLGASVVVGHHPHVPQPIEIYKDTPIIYSLGNYAFGSYSTNTPISFVAEILFSDNKAVQVNLHPIIVNNGEVNFQPRPATGKIREEIIAYLQAISAPFHTIIVSDKKIGVICIDRPRYAGIEP